MRGVMTRFVEWVRVGRLPHGEGGNQDGCATLGVELCAEGFEGEDFFFGGDAGDDVACEAAHEVRFDGWKIDFPNHHGHDGGEGVAVIEAERSHLVAAATEVHGLFEGHHRFVMRLPQLARAFVTVASRFVKGVLGLTKYSILGCDHLPSEGCEPVMMHGRHGSAFFWLPLSLELLKLRHTGTFQKSFARFRIDRFGGEAVLNRQAFCHQLFEERILQQLWINFRLHVSNLQDVRVQINSSILANGSSAFSIRL
jgi:hypothetical protein